MVPKIKNIILITLVSVTFLKSEQPDYRLAICSLFQNEGTFLKEWVEFHLLVGVQHFYLYNNYSSDNFKEILEPYIKRGIVDLKDWNFSACGCEAQMNCFNDVLKQTTGKVEWMAFLDLDEFLYPVNCDNLCAFLDDYKSCAAVCVNWFMFGTSDVKKIENNQLMIEQLIRRDPKGNKHIKTIARPECISHFTSPHFAAFKPNFFQVNPDKIKFNGPFSPYISSDKIRINHYWTRDIHYLNTVKLPRAEFLKTNFMVTDNDSWYIPKEKARSMSPSEWTLTISNYMNTEEDKTILKYIDNLRKQMFKN